jgi:hypothetical protein
MQRGVWAWLASTISAVSVLGFVFIEPAAAARYCDASFPCYKQGELAADKKDSGRRLPNAACEDLDLRVGADVGEQSCRAASISDADARARAEILSALGAGTIFLAEHINTGLHTYVHRSAPGDVAEKLGLQKVPGGPEARLQMQGFDVWRFKSEDGLQCAAFAKHWSRVPRSSGYRHRIVGVYCSQRASDVDDANLDKVLASIEPSE